MSKKLDCIMLIDDNPDDNFYHQRVIQKNDSAHEIVTMKDGQEAIDHLKNRYQHEDKHPDLILLDINMPIMNGWMFLEEFNKLDEEFQSKVVVTMLTTSENPDDKKKLSESGVAADYMTKPLTKAMLDEIIDRYF